jgi:hypothetical protein
MSSAGHSHEAEHSVGCARGNATIHSLRGLRYTTDLINRRGSRRDQAGANAVAGLELILCFLAHATQVRPQGCFSNRFRSLE